MNISTGVEKKKRKRFLAFLLSAMVTVYLIGESCHIHIFLQMTEPLKIPPPKTR